MEIVMTVGGGDCEHAAGVAVEDGCDVLFVAGGVRRGEVRLPGPPAGGAVYCRRADLHDKRGNR